jgi:hypothetical protein
MMTSTYRKGASALAVFLVFAVCTVYLQINVYASPIPNEAAASTSLLFGRLDAPLNTVVMVNGNESRSGTTILPGSQLITAEETGASVNLSSLGSVTIGPKSVLTLNFTKSTVQVALVRGDLTLTTNKGIAGSATTPDGKTERTDPSQVSTIVVHAGDTTTDDPQKKGGGGAGGGTGDVVDTGASGARLLGIFVIVGAATASLIYFERGRRGRQCGPQNPSVFLPCPVD